MFEFMLTMVDKNDAIHVEKIVLDMEALEELIYELCEDGYFYIDYCDWIDEIYPPVDVSILGRLPMSYLIHKLDIFVENELITADYGMMLWEQIADTLATEDVFEGPCGLKITRISKENPLIS